MLKSVFTVVCLCLILVSVTSAQSREKTDTESWRIEWVNDFDSAQTLAYAENKHILLDFYSDT